MLPKCSKCGSENFLLKEILVPISEGGISNRTGEWMKILYCAECGNFEQAYPFPLFDLPNDFIGATKAIEHFKAQLLDFLKAKNTV
jgi:predicted nucleic-acid-binding Zn-ribbon protein